MAKKAGPLADPGIVLVVSFFVLFLVNSLVLWLANLVFPTHVVMGTASIPYAWVFFHSIGTLALVNTFAIPFINYAEGQRKTKYSPRDWLLMYFVLNFVVLYLITRLPDQFGFGVSSWLVVGILALVLDLAQGLAMMQLEKRRSG